MFSGLKQLCAFLPICESYFELCQTRYILGAWSLCLVDNYRATTVSQKIYFPTPVAEIRSLFSRQKPKLEWKWRLAKALNPKLRIRYMYPFDRHMCILAGTNHCYRNIRLLSKQLFISVYLYRPVASIEPATAHSQHLNIFFKKVLNFSNKLNFDRNFQFFIGYWTKVWIRPRARFGSRPHTPSSEVTFSRFIKTWSKNQIEVIKDFAEPDLE